LSAVFKGELQAAGLGMSVAIYSEQGQSLRQQKGELVCTQAFPSMPIYFWSDPDNHKYQQAYFAKFPGLWTHGDYAQYTAHNGLIIYGRSDTTLNPGGIRIGTAEIYRQVEQFDAIEDSLVIGQQWQNDQRLILFVQLKPQLKLENQLKKHIISQIQAKTSIHHIPAKIIQVADIPHTYNGKLAELAVYQTIHGLPVKNKAALVNPESLNLYSQLTELQQ